MTADDLRAWQASMGLTQTQAAAALGITHAAYSALVCGRAGIDLRTALACAALAAGMKPWPECDTLTPQKSGLNFRLSMCRNH